MNRERAAYWWRRARLCLSPSHGTGITALLATMLWWTPEMLAKTLLPVPGLASLSKTGRLPKAET